MMITIIITICTINDVACVVEEVIVHDHHNRHQVVQKMDASLPLCTLFCQLSHQTWSSVSYGIMYSYCFGQCPFLRCVTCVILPLTVGLVYRDVYVAQWYQHCKTITHLFPFLKLSGTN